MILSIQLKITSLNGISSTLSVDNIKSAQLAYATTA